MLPKLKILFLCTKNSCRSQMAEGWARFLHAQTLEAHSAGIAPGALDPRAVEVMREVGIDISNQWSKGVAALRELDFDWVVTVCDAASEACPAFPRAVRKLHVSFEDPQQPAALSPAGDPMPHYRRVRDQIGAFVRELPARLEHDVPGFFLYGGDEMNEQGNERVRAAVRERYGDIARSATDCCETSCCGSIGDKGEQLGYSAEEIAAVPDGANLGLGCGNPQAIAALRAGETVLDLGAGGGFDCFLAARQVGPAGHVIGVDMTADMVARARANAAKIEAKNVEFRLGEIEHLPVADNVVDVILSNCVINLSPDKASVFREAFRVLKAGGRLAISDVVATAAFPADLTQDIASLTGCISGAAEIGTVNALLKSAGFEAIRVNVNEKSREFIKDWMPGSGLENYVASATIEAVKP